MLNENEEIEIYFEVKQTLKNNNQTRKALMRESFNPVRSSSYNNFFDRVSEFAI